MTCAPLGPALSACLLLFFFAVLGTSTALAAEDWPEFRGPTGQGIAKVSNLPAEWSQTKNVVWKKELPGAGWSSPVIVGGRIYLTAGVPAANSSEYSLRALALDAKTGEILWTTEVFKEGGNPAPRVHTKNSHASPTPLVHEGRVYVHFGHAGTACLDLDGKVLWRNTALNLLSVHGNGGSPIVVDKALIFNCDGGNEAFVAALDRKTGEVLWKTDRNTNSEQTFSFSTPLLIRVNGHPHVISAGTDMVGAYDPATGREIWRVRYMGYSVVPRPVYGNGLVYVATGFGAPWIFAIRPDGQGDVTKTHVAWKTHRGAPLTPSLLQVGDELYALSDNGVVTCFDAPSGEVIWQYRFDGNYSASPLYADGKLYFQSEQGPAMVLKAGRQYQLLAKNNLGERTLASYAVADGALFIRTAKHLYRVEKRQGDKETRR